MRAALMSEFQTGGKNPHAPKGNATAQPLHDVVELKPLHLEPKPTKTK
jgi:hypothetical protein